MIRYEINPILIIVILFTALVSGCTPETKPPAKTPDNHGEHAHGPTEPSSQAAQLILSSNPERPRAGQSVELQLMLHEESGEVLKEFEPTHEKLAHLIMVREGLDEFAHVHPTVAPTGHMTITHTFPVGGSYLVFLDHKPAGKPSATSRTKLIVGGDSPRAPVIKPNVPGTIVGDGLQAKVTLRATEEMAHIARFEVQDSDAQTVNDLQPYLGAMGHLVVLSADGTQYVHAHPLSKSSPKGDVEFEVHFPGSGIYKGWGQFQRGGRVFTIPAVMQVEGGAPHH